MRDGEERRGLKARGHGLPDVHVARDDDAVNRRGDGRVLKIDLSELERGGRLLDLRLRVLHLRLRALRLTLRLLRLRLRLLDLRGGLSLTRNGSRLRGHFGHLQLRGGLIVFGLGGLVARLRRVVFALRDDAALQERLLLSKKARGVVELRLEHGDVRLRGADSGLLILSRRGRGERPCARVTYPCARHGDTGVRLRDRGDLVEAPRPGTVGRGDALARFQPPRPLEVVAVVAGDRDARLECVDEDVRDRVRVGGRARHALLSS